MVLEQVEGIPYGDGKKGVFVQVDGTGIGCCQGNCVYAHKTESLKTETKL